MRYVFGTIFWVFGGFVLGGAFDAFTAWFGWVYLYGGIALFLPPLWELETASTRRGTRYLLRAPYLLSAAIFAVVGIACTVAMGSAVSDASIAQAWAYGLAGLLMFAAGSQLSLPVLRQIHTLRVEGRPQPIGFNVFEVARSLGGRVTPAELSANFGIQYSRAKALLSELVDLGACERIVALNGAVVYRFLELETDKVDLLEAD